MSLILTALQSPVVVGAGDVLPIGTAVHGCGKGIKLNGYNIGIREAGYYAIDATVNVTPVAAGAYTVTMYVNGVPVPGATMQAIAAAGVEINLAMPWIVKKDCGCGTTVISFVCSGAATIENAIVRVVKI